jgi:hypothetical protein
MKRLLAALMTLLLAAAAPALAQTLTGTVAGSVTDEQGGGLPGVSISLIGKARTQTTQTDEKGSYRFVGVDPGTYSVKAEVSGFRPKQQNEVQVNVGKQATVDLSLSVGGISETVDVTAEAPVVDVTSSSSDSQLSQEMLFEMPIRPDNAATDLLNYLPGINAGSAYGGDSDTGNGLLLDGVDTRDPEGGSAWTFFNFNIVEEVQVAGLGAPAEYGAFTGAVVNTITKSGGNSWEGLFDVYYTKDSLSSDNADASLTADNPLLASGDVTNKRLDYTGQISGPLVRDKAFFFASVQRFELDQDPAGPRTVRNEVSPRFNLKVNWLPSPNDTVQFTFQEDMYNVIGRPPAGIGLVVTDDITNREDAPEWVWGGQWRHLFGSKTFAEIKYTGWTGFYDLNPEVNSAGHYDAGSGEYSVSQGWFYYADRGRHQVNASLSHYAEKWGRHDLKFGVEIERSKVRSRYGYVDDLFYYDYAAYYPVGQYTAYNYGYDVEGKNKRESVFLQDSWKVNDRLTLNPGIRVDRIGGFSPALGDEKVYSTTNVSPRLGFAFDVTGDAKTVLKGHYGQYYEGAFFLAYSAATPGIEDFVLYAYDPEGDIVGPNGNRFTEYNRSVTNLATVDPDIKHPRVDEITLGFDRALTTDVRLSVTGVLREDKNLQATVLPDARWEATTVNNGLAGGDITVYNLVDPDAQSNQLITNPDGFQYLDANGNVIGTARSERKYKGLILTLDKRFKDRWQGRVSYVLSETKGTVDNSGFDSYGASVEFETPTRALVNVDGPLTNDARHELKIFASWQVPKVEANLSAYWRTISGQTYTPFQQFGSSDINFSTNTGRRVRLEPRGTEREDMENVLDLRVEKIFRVGGGDDRLSIYADFKNALNANHVNAVQNRFPSVAVAGLDDGLEYGAPTSIEAPRLIVLGARWSF